MAAFDWQWRSSELERELEGRAGCFAALRAFIGSGAFGTPKVNARSITAFIPMLFLAAIMTTGCRTAQPSERDAIGGAGEEHMAEDDLGLYRTAGIVNQSLRSPEVRGAILRVPRHLFVPDKVTDLAYEPRALPIGSGQTISQPYIVALMTEQARVGRGSRVLEIGTGSGYQAAVLAELGAEVYSIEIIPDLAKSAAERLESLGYTSVHVRQGDGWAGWPEAGPFDAILVTAATPVIPDRLLRQLANRGRLLVPLEQAEERGERLLVIERQGESFVRRDLGAVRFVPLTGIAASFRDEIEGGSQSVLEQLATEPEAETPQTPADAGEQSPEAGVSVPGDLMPDKEQLH